MEKKSLYAYFGLLGIHEIDSPGHNFYQLGLLDSIKNTYYDSKFDFYSFYPENIKCPEFNVPEGKLGKLFESYYSDLISNYCVQLPYVIQDIKEKKYEKLYLKARFRNLSTLSKKWDDAHRFEIIINEAILAGYKEEEIIILDTDLSLPEIFPNKDKVTILIPSIDFPGISSSFLKKCVDINLVEIKDKEKSIIFYGNLDTSNYKHGNSKNNILKESLFSIIGGTSDNFSKNFNVHIIGKSENDISFFLELSDEHYVIPVDTIKRNDRYSIWQAMELSLIMLNITKDKYNERRFIPARIYEAMIFGMIPISYKFEFLSKTFSFSNIIELTEIIKYLDGVGPDDWKIAYLNFYNSYLNHVK